MSKQQRGVVHVYPDKKLAGPQCMVGAIMQQLATFGILIMMEGGSWQRGK